MVNTVAPCFNYTIRSPLSPSSRAMSKRARLMHTHRQFKEPALMTTYSSDYSTTPRCDLSEETNVDSASRAREEA